MAFLPKWGNDPVGDRPLFSGTACVQPPLVVRKLLLAKTLPMCFLISLVEKPSRLFDNQVEVVAENMPLAFRVPIGIFLIGHGESRHFLWGGQAQRLDNSGVNASGWRQLYLGRQ